MPCLFLRWGVGGQNGKWAKWVHLALHYGMGQAYSQLRAAGGRLGRLGARGVFGGWLAGQIKQKLSCDYRCSCPKAVSPWVRMPQQLLVHSMLVVCTPYHHVAYAISNS